MRHVVWVLGSIRPVSEMDTLEAFERIWRLDLVGLEHPMTMFRIGRFKVSV
jgi:hypothetical protein